MIDEKNLQEKILQSEKLEDEDLEKVAGGEGGHMFENPIKDLVIHEIKLPDTLGNGGH